MEKWCEFLEHILEFTPFCLKVVFPTGLEKMWPDLNCRFLIFKMTRMVEPYDLIALELES